MTYFLIVYDEYEVIVGSEDYGALRYAVEAAFEASLNISVKPENSD